MRLPQLRHDISARPGSQHPHLQQQQPSLASYLHQKQEPVSPAQTTVSIPSATYHPPHSLGNGILHPPSPYGPPPPHDSSFYSSHQPLYTSAVVPGQYPSSGKRKVQISFLYLYLASPIHDKALFSTPDRGSGGIAQTLQNWWPETGAYRPKEHQADEF